MKEYTHKDMTMYFASPWFNEEQAEREERVKEKLRDMGFKLWSPKDNAICEPDASMDMRNEIFKANVSHIANSDILFAITDGKDIGTIWEAGYACGINATRTLVGKSRILIVYYCETIGKEGKFNLMLAQSGDIVIQCFEDLEVLPALINSKKGLAYVGTVE